MSAMRSEANEILHAEAAVHQAATGQQRTDAPQKESRAKGRAFSVSRYSDQVDFRRIQPSIPSAEANNHAAAGTGTTLTFRPSI